MRLCGVKGAIHEQLVGVKSGEACAAVYDRVYLCVCECKCVCECGSNLSERVPLYVCQCAALPDIDVVTTK